MSINIFGISHSKGKKSNVRVRVSAQNDGDRHVNKLFHLRSVCFDAPHHCESEQIYRMAICQPERRCRGIRLLRKFMQILVNNEMSCGCGYAIKRHHFVTNN